MEILVLLPHIVVSPPGGEAQHYITALSREVSPWISHIEVSHLSHSRRETGSIIPSIIEVTNPHETPWIVYGANSHKVCSMFPDGNTTSAHSDGSDVASYFRYKLEEIAIQNHLSNPKYICI